ncbi:hypothetical protein TU94_28265 [Streptomyces cyaneogriseus subsp. noncyanogenus]|uniref:Uncharacterized protein n=1 Tax=Streptomyces cyaneogriseus subsp. noncyanogenus TaxID=477245 RepID=A0A0C5FXG1_9ACTN|nr:hypothetical protein [Streptomyces cyaneogriseus]AJP04762.1 hypothetical protein TU94_28265 [Streptomyces cyaneogriseus subsp. noncyanogenus]
MDLSKGPVGPLAFKGYMASALLYEDRVEFKRPLVARLGGNRSGTVLLRDVLKVLSREPTRLVNGHVHLLTAEDPGQLRAWADAPVKQVAGNPRAIMFTWGQRDTYTKFLTAVEGALQRQRPQL